MTALAHMPVLLGEVVEALQPRDGGIYVDGTFGAGGYTRAILAARQCSVIAIDRDPTAIEGGKALVAQSHGRLTLIEGCFGDMAELLCEHDILAVDGVALDVGVSSMQIDDGARGFSFMKDGPLDMRMSSGGRMSKGGTEAGASAGDVVNTMPEAVLRNIITIYGEERRARTIARAIVAARNAKPFTSTLALADVVARAAGPAAKASGIHPATRTFQALRIYVNDELGELSRGLCAAERLLKPQGRLAVVSFHSLEDRIVKKFMAERSQVEDTGSRHAPPKKMRAPSFVLVARGGITPGESETSANPRARSARLRVAERTHGAPHPIASSSHHTLPGIEVKP